MFRFVVMEKVTHIYVYGDIINFQSSEVDDFGCVSLTSVKGQFDKNPNCEEIIVHIHSCGGDVFEGFAIHDFLVNTGKKVTTIVEGLCASIATVVFLAGSVRQLTENSRFLIHNPWTFTEGNADELEAVAADLRKEQQRLLDFYVLKTNGDAKALQLLMNEDKVIVADDALKLKFATEVIDTVKAAASMRNIAHQEIILNSLKIKTKKMKVENKTKLQGLIAKSKTLLKALAGIEDDNAETVEASSVELSDGDQLYFAEDTLAVGVAVFADAEMTEVAEDGEYTAADESVITVVAGVVDAITEAASAETDAEIIARLTTERDNALALASENEVLALALGESLATLQAASSKFKSSFKPAARKEEPNKAGVIAGKKTPKATEGSLKDGVKALKAEREAAKAAAKK